MCVAIEKEHYVKRRTQYDEPFLKIFRIVIIKSDNDRYTVKLMARFVDYKYVEVRGNEYEVGNRLNEAIQQMEVPRVTPHIRRSRREVECSYGYFMYDSLDTPLLSYKTERDKIVFEIPMIVRVKKWQTVHMFGNVVVTTQFTPSVSMPFVALVSPLRNISLGGVNVGHLVDDIIKVRFRWNVEYIQLFMTDGDWLRPAIEGGIVEDDGIDM